MIKLLLGGSPCTYWSIAQKNNREVEPSGLGWELFKNYLIAKEKFKPDFFLYENNKSAAQAIKDQIKKELKAWNGTLLMEDTGARYIEINSALVSAQNRQRFYVHNCGEVEQPEYRGILLKDILESEVGQRQQEKSRTITAGYVACSQRDMRMDIETDGFMGKQGVIEPIRIPPYGNKDKARPLGALYASHSGTGEGSLEKRLLSDNPNKEQVDLIAEPIRVGALPRPNGELSTSQAFRIYDINAKSVTINAGGGGAGGKTGLYAIPADGKTYPVYEVKNGYITIKGKQYPIKLADGYYIIRKLTVKECCRLQTLPDDFCRAVSPSQGYKGLGNGWTAEVIIHILNGALKDIPKDEEIVVLSMYDGIGTGRYCLDKMGFTNVKYYAYEIDKYAKQISMSNYPDIIQMGDAFDLRNPDWTIGY